MSALALLLWLLAMTLALTIALALVLWAAWERRVALVPLAARYFAKLELGLDDLRVSCVVSAEPLGRLAALDSPFDSLSVTLLACSIDTPFANGASSDSFAHCKSIVVRLLKRPKVLRRFDAHVVVEGMDARFVAYNTSFSDTNVQRLANSIAGPSQSTAEPLPTTEPAPATAVATADAQAEQARAEQVQSARLVVLQDVRIADASIAVQLNTSNTTEGARSVLPSILLRDEYLDLELLSGPPGLALIAWLNGVVFRTLACSSVAAVRAIFDVPLASTDMLVGHSLDLLDCVISGAGQFLPGAELASGVTSGVRALMSGAHESAGGLMDAMTATASGVAVGASSGSPLEFITTVRTGAKTLTAGVGTSASSLAVGMGGAGDSVLGGIDKFAARLGPAAGLVTGATGAAREVLGGAGAGVTSVATGLASGSGQIVGGVVGGVAGVASAMVQGDARQLIGAGEELVGGLLGGTATIAGGALGAVDAVGRGVARGTIAAAHGLGDAASAAGKGVSDGLAMVAGGFMLPFGCDKKKPSQRSSDEKSK
ncbi:hypothetical protein T492DRAFT_985805 [Pavlovales sp. CCMP2436]|nr:hypothetical protein T492DRAFT_985805 [Pavlovales sp. CCMP2436]|mmetsp:Transcript_16944/g.43352  ORF Transcript_16944/g.43352 Transcript_16944/m.43352 type:complete len:543 (+) Transcript_16944:153-1781(+)